MGKIGLLILTNFNRIPFLLAASSKYVQKTLYIQLQRDQFLPAPRFGKVITKIYQNSIQHCANLDVRVLVSNLKQPQITLRNRSIDTLLYEETTNNAVVQNVRKEMIEPIDVVPLPDSVDNDKCEWTDWDDINQDRLYPNVVLGGTFDRLHTGHKILLTAAIIRATERLVVGVTDKSMIKSKKLPELVLPVEQRIDEVLDFLNDVDETLRYEVVPISDPFGPTKDDPNLQMIVVSAETMRGGEKVNETRLAADLNALDIYCIDMLEEEVTDEGKEQKISSSNRRMDLLGSKINPPEVKEHLNVHPYVIGLVGGIASGKSVMAQRLEAFGAKVIDCDKLAHELYEPGNVCYQAVVQHFGQQIVGPDRRINREALGAIVFADPQKLTELNDIVWPKLWDAVQQRIEDVRRKEHHRVVVIDAAVLLQAGWQRNCHEIWSMIIPAAEQVKRIVERNGLSEDEARKRISSQMDNDFIVAHSNVVFSSLWSYDYTQKQLKKAWSQLMDHLDCVQSKL